MIELVGTELSLSESLNDFVSFLANKVFQFGNKFGIAVKKAELAEAYGRDTRTITRYIKELEEKEVIETSTRTGRNGGVVIMFAENLMDFKPSENPITKVTMSAEEVRDMLYPQKEKKAPNKKYRSKTEIAEEKVLKQRKQTEKDRLNDLLMGMEYPTKEFWMQTPDPELYYRAYLSSRMYNFYAVYYPTARMHKAEAERNKLQFQIYSIERDKYTNFDVLKKGFIGTSNFTNFLKFAKAMVDNKIDPAQYLTVQFDYTQFLFDNRVANAKLPFINTLVSLKPAQRWFDTEDYHKGFRKEHPYYATSADIVRTAGLGIPILNELVAEFQNPFTNRETAYQEQIDATINNRIHIPKSIEAVWAYGEDVKTKIGESSELEVNEKAELSKFITQEVATHFVSDQELSLVTYASIEQVANKKVATMNDTNLRFYYHDIGNSGQMTIDNPIERATNVKRGYKMDFSLFGARSFLNTMNMMKEIKGHKVDYTIVREAIEKFGERKIPLTSDGFLDVQAIRGKVMNERDFEIEALLSTPTMKHEENLVDIFGELWYDIPESRLGESQRDGRMIR